MKIHRCIDGHQRAFVRVEFALTDHDIAGCWAATYCESLPETRAEVAQAVRRELHDSGINAAHYGVEHWPGDARALVERVRELFPELAGGGQAS